MTHTDRLRAAAEEIRQLVRGAPIPHIITRAFYETILARHFPPPKEDAALARICGLKVIENEFIPEGYCYLGTGTRDDTSKTMRIDPPTPGDGRKEGE